MEGGVGSESGVLAPFLMKIYEMVDDSSTNNIVSWSPTNNSFVVWNTADFCRFLLPTYFKHNNLSSFIRQLNIYGFRKINHERWEFSNDSFVRDQIHLLKNIHRKKPSHNHNNNSPRSLMDPERATLEEQIEKLTNEKSAIKSHIASYKQNHSAAKLCLKDLLQQLDDMERRQNNLVNFFEEALKNPNVVEHINCKIAALDSPEYNKKRRFSSLDNIGAITGFDQSPEFLSLKPSDENDDSHNITCLHNLTLDCSPLKDNGNSYDLGSPEPGGSVSPSKNNVANETTNLILSKDHEVPSNNQGNPAPERRVNNEFWEQFFTN